MDEGNKRLTPLEWIAVLLFTAMILLVGATVFCRYFLGVGIIWSDEVARLLFVWVVFMGAFFGFQRGSHAAVYAVQNMLPKGLRRWWVSLVGVIETVFLLLIVWFGIQQISNTAQFNQKTPGLGVQMYWYYMVIPITCMLSAFAIGRKVLKIFKEGEK